MCGASPSIWPHDQVKITISQVSLMHLLSSFFILAATMLVSVSAQAANTSECSQIENRTERLLCFDREFPGTPAQLSKSKVNSEAKALVETVNTPVEEAPVEAANAEPSEEKTKNRLALGGLFDSQDQPKIETKIAAIRSGGQQRMVFRLENGQIWMQSSPRNLPFAVGNKVAIKSGRIGGYIMRSESGTSTRVKIIE